MKIKEINKLSRPREKLIKNGASNLSNEELLAILLRCGNKDKSAIELAYEILDKAGNIRNLFLMNFNELSKINGIKEAKASIIMASIELSKRAISYKGDNTIYDDPKYIYELIKPLVCFEKTEVFYVIYLDSLCKIIKYEKLSVGNFGAVNIPKQKIYQDAILNSARAVIISHNHPSGDPTPSDNDIEATLEIKDGLELVGINLIDHIIIGDNKFYSFSSKHLIL